MANYASSIPVIPINPKSYENLDCLVYAVESKNKYSNAAPVEVPKPLVGINLPIGRPNLGSRALFHHYVDAIFDSRHITNDGPYLQAFEKHLANYGKVKHALCFCNATAGLELLVATLPIRPFVSQIIVPSFTFVATVHSIHRQQCVPVFVDIDPVTFCMDAKKVKELINEHTVAIMPVHLYGNVCNVEELDKIGVENNVPVFYDAAHSFASYYKSRPVGSFGKAEVLSFHATKFFNSIEGGALLTNDDDLAAQLRSKRNYGFAGYDKVTSWGTNAKLNEFAAAMGLVSFHHAGVIMAKNRLNFLNYYKNIREIRGLELITLHPVQTGLMTWDAAWKDAQERLACAMEEEEKDLKDVFSSDSAVATASKNVKVDFNLQDNSKNSSGVLPHHDGVESNFQYIIVRVKPEYGISRDALVKLLHREGIIARRYFYPGVHLMEPYLTLLPAENDHLVHTNRASNQVMALPTGECVGEEQIQQICNLLKFIQVNSEQVKQIRSY